MKRFFWIAAIAARRLLLPGVRAADEPVSITAGKSFVIDSPSNIERVAVASEDVVEAVAITQREIMLNGKAPVKLP